jgi:hypothetical protein
VVRLAVIGVKVAQGVGEDNIGTDSCYEIFDLVDQEVTLPGQLAVLKSHAEVNLGSLSVAEERLERRGGLLHAPALFVESRAERLDAVRKNEEMNAGAGLFGQTHQRSRASELDIVRVRPDGQNRRLVDRKEIHHVRRASGFPR